MSGCSPAASASEITRIRGIRNMLFGGDGIFLAALTGPGRIWFANPHRGQFRARPRPLFSGSGSEVADVGAGAVIGSVIRGLTKNLTTPSRARCWINAGTVARGASLVKSATILLVPESISRRRPISAARCLPFNRMAVRSLFSRKTIPGINAPAFSGASERSRGSIALISALLFAGAPDVPGKWRQSSGA